MPQTPQPERTNLASLLDTMASRWTREIAAVEHRGVRRYATGYAALAGLARRFAAELERRGIRKGERVVLCGANSAEWMAVFYGCVLRGVLPVPLDAVGTGTFALRVAREVAPQLIVSDEPPGETPTAAAQIGAAAALVDASRTLGAPLLTLRHLAASLPREEAGAIGGLSADDALQILFTSGTTGEPKGIVHTHGNLLASITPIEREIEKYRRYERWVHPLRILHTLPLSHVFGQFMGLWVPPLLGAAVHYESRTVAARLLDLIPSEKINVLAAVPRTLDLMRAHLLAQHPQLAAQLAAAAGEPPQKRWWRFRGLHRRLGFRFWAAVCGGATLPAELESFWTTLGFALIQGYGLTETSALVTLNHPFRAARGSLGAPLPGRVLRVSETGELEVQGSMVSRATWQNGQMVTREDPWLATGDLAEVDDDGRVRLLGRTGQRLVTPAGLNVYLRDVEEALTAMPAIDDALVFAWRTAEGIDEPAAAIVARSGSDAATRAVAQANAALAPHQRVRRWQLWPELAFPRTSTGKIKRAVVEQWAQGAFADTAAAMHGADGMAQEYSHSEDALLTLLRSLTGRKADAQERRDDAARLEEDWGLDSMARVSLASALEDRLGLALDDGRVAELQTLGELRELLQQADRSAATETPSSPPTATPAVHKETQSISPETIQSATAKEQIHISTQQTAIPAMHYPQWPWSLPVVALRILFLEAIARPLVWLLAAPRVHARLTAAALTAPSLLISNHRTAMDVPLLLYALPFRIRRRVVVAMSGEMLAGWEHSWSRTTLPREFAAHRRWWGPIASFLLRALFGVFPLPRTTGFQRSFLHAGRALDRGFHVLIFPEGHRSSGELASFRNGTGLLWSEAETAVLPLALWIDPAHPNFRFRSHPAVCIGNGIPQSDRNTLANLTQSLHAEVSALLTECQSAGSDNTDQ